MARPEHEKDDKFRLSYSAASDLHTCQQLYAWKKVHKVRPDVEQDTYATRFGSAFHSCQEWSLHELSYFEDKKLKYVDQAIKENELPTDDNTAGVLLSAVTSSLQLWKETGLRVIACEIEIRTDTFVGYIDFIAIDPTECSPEGYSWWIGDLKSTSLEKGNGGPRLRRDAQLALYVAHADLIVQEINNNPQKYKVKIDRSAFKGCLWRETSRTTLKPRLGEKPEKFAKRCPSESRIYVIPTQEMSSEPIISHNAAYAIASEIHAGTRVPTRAYGKVCMDQFRKPCAYWSYCFGKRHDDFNADLRCITLTRDKGNKGENDHEIQISDARLTGYRYVDPATVEPVAEVKRVQLLDIDI